MNGDCPWRDYERPAAPSASAKIAALWATRTDKIIVLDDDPTGCQTVHGVPIWLEWDAETLRAALLGEHRLFYLLTNIRSINATEAELRHDEIAQRLHVLAEELGLRVHVISRSDSTLRGHFPADLRPFWRHGVASEAAAILLIPAFFEGGRYTFQGTHYVMQEGVCVPANETEFANDQAFGFDSAYLPQWVAEKWPEQQGQVEVLGIDVIRQGVPAVARHLAQVHSRQVIVVDALDYADLEVVALACLEQQATGQEFLFRTAASFVRVYGGISAQELLSAQEFVQPSSNGGLVIVGSYVAKTTTQLHKLMQLEGLALVELDVQEIVQGNAKAEVARAIETISKALESGSDVVCFTSRKLWEAGSAKESLQTGRAVADSVNAVVQGLVTRPSFLVAKGGITSHEVAQFGLSVRETWVLGQIASGIPIWELRSESKWPGLPYVVFPGNVGTADTLAEVVQALRQARRRELR